MSWMTIESAPKDDYVLGMAVEGQRPFVMLWNIVEACFIENTLGDPAKPTHWMRLPSVPKKGVPGEWLPLDQAPKRGYCLGYDECLKRPFVMSWRESKQKFVVQDGFGDEEPSLCLLIPPLMVGSNLELALAA